MPAYDWDPTKTRANLAKHGVDFPDAALVLEDPRGQLLVVVWTPRGERFRLLSARRATTAERRQYEG